MPNKRNRSVNWDDEEKHLFRNILKDYTQIIEDKTLTTSTNKLKAKAWEEVCQKFNSLNRRQRELIQLKIQWKGMKILARKTRGTFKKEINKTVGEERPSTPDDTINEMLNPADLIRDRNGHDSDGILSSFQEITPARIFNNIENSGGMSRKDSHDDYVEKLTTHSKELKEKDKELIENRRMEMAEEKHAAEMEIIKFKYKCIEEKHAMEMKILKLECQITEEKLRSAKKQDE